MSQEEFNDVGACVHLSTSLDNMINSKKTTPTMYSPVSDTNAMDISAKQENLKADIG